MINPSFLAHAEQAHTEATSDIEHTLTDWPIAIILYFGINLIVFRLIRNSRKSATIPVMLGLNLTIGLLTYDFIPAVSIIAITLGIGATLVIALTLIAGK